MDNRLDLDFYDYVVFPEKDICEEATTQYFDTQKLRININIPYHARGFYDLMNLDKNTFNHIGEKIRKFDNTIVYLNLAIMRMYNYYLKLDCKNKDEALVYQFLFRYECRNICCEIFVYIEKIKSMIRFLGSMDLKATKRNDGFIKEFKKLAETDNDFASLLNISTTFFKGNYNFVENIRNDEIHNESKLDDYTREIKQPTRMIITNPRLVIGNNELYNKILLALNDLPAIKDCLVAIIVKKYI